MTKLTQPNHPLHKQILFIWQKRAISKHLKLLVESPRDICQNQTAAIFSVFSAKNLLHLISPTK